MHFQTNTIMVVIYIAAHKEFLQEGEREREREGERERERAREREREGGRERFYVDNDTNT